MYSKLGTAVAVLIGAFPFFALGYKIFEVSATVIIVYVVILVILVAGLMIAPRLNLATVESADGADTRTREPAPPIAWSWDGVNRQPGDENE